MNREIETQKALLANFDLMIKVSTSWSKLSNILEKFDCMKKLNFNFIKLYKRQCPRQGNKYQQQFFGRKFFKRIF
jgi:hypothetical protein